MIDFNLEEFIIQHAICYHDIRMEVDKGLEETLCEYKDYLRYLENLLPNEIEDHAAEYNEAFSSIPSSEEYEAFAAKVYEAINTIDVLEVAPKYSGFKNSLIHNLQLLGDFPPLPIGNTLTAAQWHEEKIRETEERIEAVEANLEYQKEEVIEGQAILEEIRANFRVQ